jgi:hypothetical protein
MTSDARTANGRFAQGRVDARSDTMQTRIRHALGAGPAQIAELMTRLGIARSDSLTDAGRQSVKYQLRAMVRLRLVRRIGNRRESTWALIGHRGTVPTRTPSARIVRRPDPAPPKPPSTSWWLVSDEEFGAVCRQRADLKQFSSIALMGTLDRE